MAQLAADQLSSSSTLISSADSTTSKEVKHPQDVTLLKAAWEAMLSHRFISSKLLSVPSLPFYISSCFVNVQTLPLFQVPLPTNSGTAPQLKLRMTLLSHPHHQGRRRQTDCVFLRPSSMPNLAHHLGQLST